MRVVPLQPQEATVQGRHQLVGVQPEPSELHYVNGPEEPKCFQYV